LTAITLDAASESRFGTAQAGSKPLRIFLSIFIEAYGIDLDVIRVYSLTLTPA
jgi:hypothetical protein